MEESHSNGNSNVNGNGKQQAIGRMRNASNLIVEGHKFTKTVCTYIRLSILHLADVSKIRLRYYRVFAILKMPREHRNALSHSLSTPKKKSKFSGTQYGKLRITGSP